MKFVTQRKIRGERQKYNDRSFTSKIYYVSDHKDSHFGKKRSPNLLKRISWRYLIPIVLILAFVIFLLNLFLGTKYKLENFEIQGNNIVSSQEITEALSLYKGNNLFLVFPSKIESYLKSKFILFDNVLASKIFPDKLILKIQEKPLKYFVNCTDSNFVLSSDNQIIFKDISEVKINFEDAELPIINGQFNLNDIPITSDLEIQKAKALAISDEKTRLDVLAKIDKLALDFRLSKYKLLIASSYKKLNDALKQNDIAKNKYHLQSINCFNSKNLFKQDYLSKMFGVTDKLTASVLEIPIESILFINDSKILGITKEKVFIFSLNSSIENQIQRLNFVIKDFRTRNESFVQINVTDQKVIVL